MAAERREAGRESRRYSGGLRNLLRDGFGVYVYPNRFFRYEGQWRKGKKHGRGKFIMKDGSFYEGEFVDGEMEGSGSRYWARTGNSYSGQFHCGEPHGVGVMQYGSGDQYEGQFSYGLREGHGVLIDKLGQKYEGCFHENKKHGEGKMNFRNGDRYEGGWLFDQRQGHGVIRYRNGSIYEGQWRNNRCNGQGTMIDRSGVVYEGLWMNGRPCCDGFEVISYPLMERAFESHGPRSAAPLAAAKSGFAQADSPVPEGQPGSGGGSDGATLGRDTPSYLDGRTESKDPSARRESVAILESFPGQFDEQKEDFSTPPASQRTEAGEATFQNLMLAPSPMSEVEKAAWPLDKGLPESLASALESITDSR
ncbi:MORN repeat-containing protein 1 [Arapaima gigas]